MSHALIPHLWMVGPTGWLCVAGQHGWGGGGSPYGPCVNAQPYAVAALREGERLSGQRASVVAASLGINVEDSSITSEPSP